MKKQAKLVVVVLTVVMVLASVLVLASCAQEETKTAYGLVHREGYVGIATVVVKDGVLVSASLDEACFPTQVKATAADGDHTVAVVSGEGASQTTTYYYKTVKYGSVTMTYDAASKGYMVGTQAIKDYFRGNEERCKEYAEAVKANGITVVTSTGEKTDIMTAKTLLKTENGYWSGSSIHEGQLGWKANAEATCEYVMKNGFDAVTAKSDFTQPNKATGTGDKADEWVDKNNVKTGATWTDLWDYVSLLKAAFEK